MGTMGRDRIYVLITLFSHPPPPFSRNRAINYKSDLSVSWGKTSRDSRLVSYPRASLLYRQMLNAQWARVSYLRRLPFRRTLFFIVLSLL